MAERRAEKRQRRNRRPMHEEIVERLVLDHEPTVTEILAAISACGWRGVATKKRVSISFSPQRPPLHFELDLFLVGLKRTWKKKIRDREKAAVKPVVTQKPNYETLVTVVNRFIQTGKYDSAACEWLDFMDAGSPTDRCVTVKKVLQDLLAEDASADGAMELRKTIEAAAVVRDQRFREIKDKNQKDSPIAT